MGEHELWKLYQLNGGVSEISDDGSTDGDPQGVSEQTAVLGDLGTEASHLLFAGMGGPFAGLSQRRLQGCEGSHSRNEK